MALILQEAKIHFMFLNIVSKKILIDHKVECLKMLQRNFFCVANATLAVNEQRMELDETG